MADARTIKKIGYSQAFKAITIGLVIAYIIFGLMAEPFWLFQFDYAPTILFGAIMIYIAGYFLGGLTGICISKHSRLAILFGIIGGLFIVWTGTFFGSLIGFVKEGLANNSVISESIRDYIYKPMALVTIFGMLPIIIVGIWFGLSIKKRLIIFNNLPHYEHI